MPIDLTGLPIAITGASSGIGAATAFACADAGMPVALAARRLDRLEALAERINTSGGRAIGVACDVTDPHECEQLVARTIEAFGSIYAVFANAGYGVEGSVLETPDSDHRAMFETNFWGTLNTIRPAASRMIDAGRGHVLICSSCLSKIGLPYYAHYCATKSAQDLYGRALGMELACHRVHVSTVHPVGTTTEFFEKAAERNPDTKLIDFSSKRFMQPPERVARAIVACLRRPRNEVWTSPLRFGLALAGLAPNLRDRLIRNRARRRADSRKSNPTGMNPNW